jgi:hypothetical protein
MDSRDFRYVRDAEGRLVARARGESAEAARTAQFLTEDCQSAAYAESLLQKAQAALSGVRTSSSSNAYDVAFGDGEAVISHLWLKDWLPVRLTLHDFAGILAAWRRHIL